MTPEERRRLTVENREAIAQNLRVIKQNRTLIGTLAVFLIVSVIAVVYLLMNQHDMEACQAKLFTHITGMTAPTDEELSKGIKHFKPVLEAIENPEVYRDLFESCQ